MPFQPLVVCVSLLFLSTGAVNARPKVKFEANDAGVVTHVLVTGLPALSKDGRTLVAPGSGQVDSDMDTTDKLQATLWGGVRTSYLFDDYNDGATEQEYLDGKRLKRLIRRRSFRSISMKKPGRDGSVRIGRYKVRVTRNQLFFNRDNKLIYSRKIKARLGRGAGLMGEGMAEKLEVVFLGAYIDPEHKVFVVSYGTGECDCACDLAAFFQHYRWETDSEQGRVLSD